MSGVLSVELGNTDNEPEGPKLIRFLFTPQELEHGFLNVRAHHMRDPRRRGRHFRRVSLSGALTFMNLHATDRGFSNVLQKLCASSYAWRMPELLLLLVHALNDDGTG